MTSLFYLFGVTRRTQEEGTKKEGNEIGSINYRNKLNIFNQFLIVPRYFSFIDPNSSLSYPLVCTDH